MKIPLRKFREKKKEERKKKAELFIKIAVFALFSFLYILFCILAHY
jgi:hypothetical protein